MSTGTIVQVDPATLTIALNVRTDVTVNKEFVASIKQLGVLQPPMVTVNADGGYDVVLGQRRTLAAVEAGLKTIPVYVVDQLEADAARVVDQLTENDQRQGLTEHERVAGYKQLSLFGVSPAQIAKRTSTDRARVDTALAVADNATATSVLRDYELTLDEAAVIVEFDDDPTAVSQMVTAAREGKLQHVAAELRKKRQKAARVAELQAELEQEVAVVLAPANNTYASPDRDGAVRIDDFGKPEDPRQALEPSDIIGTPFAAGRVVAEAWTGEVYGPTKQYFVMDAEANGIPKRVYGQAAREVTPEEQAEEESRDAERRLLAEREEALVAAAFVRWAWVGEFMQRKKLPADVLLFVARSSFSRDALWNSGTCKLLGVPVPEDADYGVLVEAVGLAIASGPKEVERALLAAFLVPAERVASKGGQIGYYSGPEPEVVVDYLPQLVEWGYVLSDAEQALLDECRAALTEDVDEDLVDAEIVDEDEDDDE